MSMMVYRFLIVDDTQFMRKMATDSLKQFNYEVAGEAINGKEAIEKYGELKPDIVLMDLTMPEMNGVDAIKNILQSDPDAVILVCSSSNQKEMIEEALKAGAKGYLTKPFKPENMEEVIRKYAIPHIDAARKNAEVVAASKEKLSEEIEMADGVEVDEVVEAVEAVDVSIAITTVADDIEMPVPNPPSPSKKQTKVSNFVTSSMCSWKEEVEGISNSYAVTCTGQENKLVIEWT